MKAPPPSKALCGLTLDVSLLILTTLHDAARVAPVPYLMEAADLALGILNIVQNMKDCKEGFKRLASDSCGLVYAIVGAHSNTVVASDDLDIHVKELLGTLQSIYAFSQKELKRGILRRIIRNNSDCAKILEYREALRQSLDVFGLQSTVSIRENIARITKNQEEIVRHLEQQSTQGLDLTQLLVEALENTHTEKTALASPPINTSLSPPPAPHSKNPFRNPSWPHIHPLRVSTLSGPLCPDVPQFTPHYYVTGDFTLEDKSRHIENSNSNNTVTTITLGSNNHSFISFYGS